MALNPPLAEQAESATMLAVPRSCGVPLTVAVKETLAPGVVLGLRFVQTFRVPCQPPVALLSIIALLFVLPAAVNRLVLTGDFQVTVGGGVLPTVTLQGPKVPKFEDGFVARADKVSDPAWS